MREYDIAWREFGHFVADFGCALMSVKCDVIESFQESFGGGLVGHMIEDVIGTTPLSAAILHASTLWDGNPTGVTRDQSPRANA